MVNKMLQLFSILVIISIAFGQKCDDISFDIDSKNAEDNNYEYCSRIKYVKEGDGNITFSETTFTGCSGDVLIRAHGPPLARISIMFKAGEKKTELIQTYVKDKAVFRICAKGKGCTKIEGKACQVN